MSINAVYEDGQGNVRESRMDGVDLTAKISIADGFSAMVNYAVGDFCYHLGTLYKCTTAHTAGAWDAAHFTATQVGDEIGELKNTLSKHLLGNPIAITNYTSDSPYICPSDGYIRMNVRIGGTLYAFIDGIIVLGITEAAEQNIQSVRVNKRSSIYTSNVVGNAELVFIPLQ